MNLCKCFFQIHLHPCTSFPIKMYPRKCLFKNHRPQRISFSINIHLNQCLFQNHRPQRISFPINIHLNQCLFQNHRPQRISFPINMHLYQGFFFQLNAASPLQLYPHPKCHIPQCYINYANSICLVQMLLANPNICDFQHRIKQ